MTKRYLFVIDQLFHRGGGEGLACWVLNELLSRGDVTILTFEDYSADVLDDRWGTELTRFSPRVVKIDSPVRQILKKLGVSHRRFDQHLLARKANRLSKSCHYTIVLRDELDTGEPALQIVYYPVFSLKLLKEDIELQPTLLMKLFGWLNLLFCQLVFPWSDRRVAKNFTVAISEYAASVFVKNYDKKPETVLFPPPTVSSRKLDLARRSAFLSIGRLDPVKRWPQIIKIVERLRNERGHEVELTLAGSIFDAEYYSELKEKYGHLPWLAIKTDISREELDVEIASHCFGIHNQEGEHYGMAVSELLLGGCLTAVHDSGGQIEIVTESEMRFTDVDDAVNKLDPILADAELQARLLESQQSRRQAYTRETFEVELRRCLDRFETEYSRAARPDHLAGHGRAVRMRGLLRMSRELRS